MNFTFQVPCRLFVFWNWVMNKVWNNGQGLFFLIDLLSAWQKTDLFQRVSSWRSYIFDHISARCLVPGRWRPLLHQWWLQSQLSLMQKWSCVFQMPRKPFVGQQAIFFHEEEELKKHDGSTFSQTFWPVRIFLQPLNKSIAHGPWTKPSCCFDRVVFPHRWLSRSFWPHAIDLLPWFERSLYRRLPLETFSRWLGVSLCWSSFQTIGYPLRLKWRSPWSLFSFLGGLWPGRLSHRC